MTQPLSEFERGVLAAHRDAGRGPQARRAQIVLLSADGAAAPDIAEAVGLSLAQVRYWLREWRKRRLDIFPDQAEASTGADHDEDDAYLPETAEAAEITPDTLPPSELEPVPGVMAPRLALSLTPTVGLLPDDPMAEAGRKVLLFHFERMLLNEPGSRLGADIEAVHDMRVATRRMRSAIRLFGPFFEAGVLAPFRKELSHTANTLGGVRDLDVSMDKAQRYLDAHPDENLDPLFDLWHAALEAGRAQLIEELDNKRFARFVKRFHAFLTTPGAGALHPPCGGHPAVYQVRHVAPRLIYEHYERVRAYEAVLDGAPLTTLHALRIEFKRLRYTVEFFEEVLGPEAKTVIKAIKAMQDHLGDLNDTVVVSTVLRDFVDAHNREYSGVPIFMRPDITGVIHYAIVEQDEQRHLLETFPEAWAAFTSDDVRRSLALAIAAL